MLSANKLILFRNSPSVSWRGFVRLALVALSLCANTVSVYAQGLEELAVSQQRKVETALNALNAQREAIQGQQIPLVQSLDEWENKARLLRTEVGSKQAVRDSKSIRLETLRSTVNAQTKQYDYITRTLFNEYFANYQALLSVGEAAAYNEPIKDYNLLLDQPDLDELEKLEAALALVAQSLGRIDSLIGGKRYAGEALNEDGQLVSGQFIQCGPLLYFNGEGDTETGIVEESKTLLAKIRPLDKSLAKPIQVVARTGEGYLPVDASLGNALALEQTEDGVLEHVRKGGVWVYPILLFAFISTIVAVAKGIQIFSQRQPEPLIVHDIIKLLRSGDTQKAGELAARQPGPASALLMNAVEHAEESVELVEEVLYESMLSIQPRLERFLNIIAVTAAIAPLLGLLGTVTGIIKTFKLMNVFGAGDPKPLISGISEALITTELGLVLAIPALLIHTLLSRKVTGIMAGLERLTIAFINGISRKAPGV